MDGFLGFDIGARRTGVAYLHPDHGVSLALPTIRHASADALIVQILALCKKKNVARCVLGLPLLPSGAQGAQAEIVLEIAHVLRGEGLQVALLDERYTTPRKDGEFDGDSAAAVDILSSYFDRENV